MGLESCEALREATRGCLLVLLTATDAEAEPLLQALQAPATYVMATKKVVVGRIAAEQDPTKASVGGGGFRAALAVSGCDKANTAHILACLLMAMDPLPLLVIQVGAAGAFLEPLEGTDLKIGPEPPVGSGLGVPSSSGVGRLPGGGQRPAVGDLVFATEEIYSDTGSSSPAGWISAGELGLPIARVDGIESGERFPLDLGLVRAAVDVIDRIDDGDWPDERPAVFTGPCVTSSRVTGVRSEGESVARRWGALAESMEGAAAAHVCGLHGVPFLEVRGISNLVVDRDRASWDVTRAVEVAGRAAVAVAAALDTLPLPKRPPSSGCPPPPGA